MSEGTNSIADDILRNGYERWQRLEGEKQAISDDLKELFAELKGNGFDGKAIRKAFRKVATADDVEVQEVDALVDLYVDSLMAPKKSRSGTIVANAQARDARGQNSKPDPLAALRADPALAIVEPAIIESKLHKVQNAQTEPQPTKAAGSDLTSLAPHEGQVAPIPTAVEGQRSTPVADVGGSGEDHSHGDADSESGSAPLTQQGIATPDSLVNEVGRPQSATLQSDTSDRKAPPSASPVGAKYAKPGVITWESTPPEGVERHPYSSAFGDLGQDIHVIADDLAKAASDPVVKIGNVILDGWARYMTARGAVGLDGHSTEYPVVQYDGADPLLDCIRWNIAGRILSDKDKQTVVARLIAIEPKRKAEIIKAVAEMAI